MTHTFHLPVDEIPITLQDVHQLLDLPIHGQHVTLPSSTNTDWYMLVSQMLGTIPEDPNGQGLLVNKGSLTMTWLRDTFSATPSQVIMDEMV